MGKLQTPRKKSMSRILLMTLLLTVASVANLNAQPPEGSQLSVDENSCATCHGEADLWEGETLRLYVPHDSLANDVHWNNGVNCHDCHGGDPSSFDVPQAHGIADPEEEAAEEEAAEEEAAEEEAAEEEATEEEAAEEEATEEEATEEEATEEEATEEEATEEEATEEEAAEDEEEEEEEEDVIDFRATMDEVRQVCGNCHKDQLTAVRMGVHQKAGEKDERGAGTIMTCGKCHGEKVHGMLAKDDTRSPVFLDNQIETCGECHEEYLATYKESVHGLGLSESGLLVTASCADCHGAHDIYYAGDKRSRLHPTKVAKTCGECHRFIEERLQKSVHGRGGLGERSEKAAPGGKEHRTPSCTSCHQSHDLQDPKSAGFRLRLPNRCGNCHVDFSKAYAMSMHGQLTELGYGPAAKCSDCHGAHDILPVNDPQSRLSDENRRETCQECHPYAVENFANFHPHANHHDAERHPWLHMVYVFMEILLYSVFGVFGLHTAAWFLRSLVHTMIHGRPKRLQPGKPAYVRFESIHRTLHVVVIVSFLGLAITGLPLKYSSQPWAKTLARGMGGFDSTSVLHYACALATFGYFICHISWLARRVYEAVKQKTPWLTILFGPDSPVPNFRDAKDAVRMSLWFVGLGKKPVFERWTYWEKFDYWAVFWGIGIIGATGLMLWFPNLFCRFLPGEVLNIAKVIHSEEALLATGFIFAIHFFNTHLRAEKFPMDMAMLTGLVTEEEMEHERPEWLERLQEEGEAEDLHRPAPSRAKLCTIMAGGAVALIIGWGLLLGMLFAAMGK